MTLQRIRYNGNAGTSAKNDFGPQFWNEGDEADVELGVARSLVRSKNFDAVGRPFEPASVPHVEPPIIGLDADDDGPEL